MDKFEYSTVRLELVYGSHPTLPGQGILEKALVVITKYWDEAGTQKSQIEEIEIEDVLTDTTRNGCINGHIKKSLDRYLSVHPTDILLPYMAQMGTEGWEVINYSSSESFGEALLKRKIKD